MTLNDIHLYVYDHLYYYVPQFINYPYDEFSSTFDIILFFIKRVKKVNEKENKNIINIILLKYLYKNNYNNIFHYIKFIIIIFFIINSIFYKKAKEK